ncbi:glycosyltransferase [Proteiniborus sp. MB09-C3]|uniref:glycosyltransferase n=1 Tax=Proteiniborus sp. MB09-C3 TaxID=3050072 RepID=UPI002553E97A|nr:glycosyltransferase [Proteiniborus sp. MB09-C3]WIV10981.1 glycosyltransferase [Proteiniborus sp. MB09-C3]
MNISSIMLFFISGILSFIAIPLIYGLLINNNCKALNYRKEQIPVGMGLVFILTQSFVVFIYVLYKNIKDVFVFSYIISILMIGLIGIIDDIIGEKEVKGFKGHISSLIKLRLTTGGLKLIVGGMASLLVSLTISTNIIDIIINGLIIGLFTNLINLFDLRPGRASKVFILLSIILIFSSRLNEYNYVITSLLGIVLVYLPYDLKAKSMMGDVGSNVLGMTLGAFCAGTQSILIKSLYLVLLIVLHIISECYSLTEIIDNNRLLCYIDKLGRK